MILPTNYALVTLKINDENWVWGCTSVIPALRRLK
jgi:hypothetical protein